jgi:hypothetical protein
MLGSAEAGFLLELVILLIHRDPTKVVKNPVAKVLKIQMGCIKP